MSYRTLFLQAFLIGLSFALALVSVVGGYANQVRPRPAASRVLVVRP